MTTDTITTLTTDALDQLATLLDQGHSDRLTALFRAMARFHKYSWHNTLLIATQCPTATRVAGFHTWRGLGRFVRRGEKGIAIIAPVATRRRERDAVDEPVTDDHRVSLRFRTAYVFDVAQTDGEQLPELAHASGDPGPALTAIRTAILEQGIAVEEAAELGGALGLSLGGRIQVVAGLAPAEALMVLAHEWAHELLHRDHDRPPSRATRELEAEAVAFVIGTAVGLHVAEASADYVMLYRGDRDGLVASLARIQRAAAVMLAAIGAEPLPSAPSARVRATPDD